MSKSESNTSPAKRTVNKFDNLYNQESVDPEISEHISEDLNSARSKQ